MIHQHFKLIEVLTAAENIILGLPGKMTLNMDEVIKDIQALVDKYGFELDCRKKIYEMSVSEKQTVEIVKMLYRGSDILILDEPTNALDEQGVAMIAQLIRKECQCGALVVVACHDADFVQSVSDVVIQIQAGRVTSVIGK